MEQRFSQLLWRPAIHVFFSDNNRNEQQMFVIATPATGRPPEQQTEALLHFPT